MRMLNRDKSGTPGRKRDKMASRETSDFFPGLEVKNRDCPGKSGTDGHLNLDTIGKQNYQELGIEAELNFEFFEFYHYSF